MTDSDTAGLEARLKIVEDKLAIYELIASHRGKQMINTERNRALLTDLFAALGREGRG